MFSILGRNFPFTSLQIKGILLLVFIGSLYDALFITSYVNVIIRETLNSPSLIAALLILRSTIRTICDTPVGILVDKKIGTYYAIAIAIVLKICYVLCFLVNSKWAIFLGAAVEGLSISFFRIGPYRALFVPNSHFLLQPFKLLH